MHSKNDIRQLEEQAQREQIEDKKARRVVEEVNRTNLNKVKK